jgi:pimeloyl-ACP methyl ester carboxylesterase
VIPPLQADGYEVLAAQYGLDTPEGDVATVKPTLGRVGSPAILVGHSYRGSVITAAGTDERVAGLVYIGGNLRVRFPQRPSESDAFSRDLKRRGFSFVGSTVIYAHMQAVGMVNDHLIDCYRYRDVRRLGTPT